VRPPAPRHTRFPYTTLFRSIADVVRNYPFEIVIEGHSDSGFGSNARFGRPESLALARAAAAAEVMTRSGKLDSKRLALAGLAGPDRKSTRLNSSHVKISYAV